MICICVLSFSVVVRAYLITKHSTRMFTMQGATWASFSFAATPPSGRACVVPALAEGGRNGGGVEGTLFWAGRGCSPGSSVAHGISCTLVAKPGYRCIWPHCTSIRYNCHSNAPELTSAGMISCTRTLHRRKTRLNPATAAPRRDPVTTAPSWAQPPPPRCRARRYAMILPRCYLCAFRWLK